MTNADGSDRARTTAFLVRIRIIVGVATILFVALLAAFAIWMVTPMSSAPSTAQPTDFSAERAFAHVSAISQQSRPLGSSSHSQVRDYILTQLRNSGVTPEVQRTTAVNSPVTGTLRAGTVENIVARLSGTSNSKAILLVSHYDSVSTSFGAGDDGSGVAVLLETLRALKNVAALKNDVIFLFTDGEEVALLGAQAFVAEHPWAKDVGLVLNFEARGVSGSSMLFETSNQNGRLIREFAKAAPHPVATSLAYEIYRLLPNNTDLTVFKAADLPGLNFAFIDGSTHYHTQLDNSDNIDRRSIQHQGGYALSLTKHFGNLDLQNMRDRNKVYFDVLGLYLVSYSNTVVPVITLVVTVLFLVLIYLGWKKGRLTPVGIAIGSVTHLGVSIVVPLLLVIGWLVVRLFGRSTHGLAYQSKLCFVGFALLAVAISYSAYAVLLRRSGGGSSMASRSFMATSLGWWTLFLILATVLLPGVTFLLAWPLFFCLPSFAYQIFTRQKEGARLSAMLFFLLATVPTVLMLAPAIYVMSIGLNLNSIGIVMFIVVLVCTLLVPHFLSLQLETHRALVTLVAIVGVITIGLALVRSGHDPRQPKLNNLFYGLNADTGKSIWGSFDDKPDEWTSRALSTKPEKRTAPEFFATGRAGVILQADAGLVSLSAPDVSVIADSTTDSVRKLKLLVTSARQAPVISIYFDSVKDLRALWINEKRGDTSGKVTGSWSVFYYNVPAQGIELTLEFSSDEPLKMRAVDQSFGLPDLQGNGVGARPPGIIPAPMLFSDAIVVSKSFHF